MKKLLLILSIFSCLTLFSCDREKDSNTDLPTEVNKLRHTSQFDTVLVIKTDKKVYEFDYKTQEFVKSTIVNQENDATIIVCTFLFILFLILIILS